MLLLILKKLHFPMIYRSCFKHRHENCALRCPPPPEHGPHIHSNNVGTNDSTTSPNSPHPTIEYPPLYFVIRRYPRIMSAVCSVYRVRWEVNYPLQRRVPLSKKLRKIGITCCTWGELLLWTPFMFITGKGIFTSFIHPSVIQSGIVSRLPLIICFLTANHNSLLTLLLGIPFERAMKYHKVSGYLAFINGIFHTIVAYITHKSDIDNRAEVKMVKFAWDGQVNTSGTLLLITIIFMIITASPYIRRKAFEVFYYFHILFSIAMMGFAFYHSGMLVPLLASILWGGDILMRIVYMAHVRYPSKATIITLTDTVVEIRFSKVEGFDYNPGQVSNMHDHELSVILHSHDHILMFHPHIHLNVSKYVKIAVPELSLFQWHPISISSSPHQHDVTLHVRKVGVWTSRLHELSQKKNSIHILLEGPYGSLGVDLTSNRYSMVMMLSGGIGVTPMQSITHQLMYEHETKERRLKKIWFIWTARDPQVMSSMGVMSKNTVASKLRNRNPSSTDVLSSNNEDDVSGKLRESMSRRGSDASMRIISQHALAMIPPCTTTDEDLDRELPLEGYEETEEGGIFTETDKEAGITRDRESALSPCSVSNGVLELDCYITTREMHETGMNGMDLPVVHQRRPEMKEIFIKMRDEAKRQGERRIAICVCAPLRLTDITRKSCVKFSDRDVQFDFHSESF